MRKFGSNGEAQIPRAWRDRIPGMIALLLATSLAGSMPAEEPAPAKLGLCVACHGTDGRSRTPAAPHIGGQNEVYLVWALNQYREGRREGDVMKVREVVRASVRSSVRWLGGLRTELQGDSASEQLRATLERYRGQSGTASFTGEAA